MNNGRKIISTLIVRVHQTSTDIATNEPPHDKTNKMTVRPAKTQISLGVCPVWSESSLCTQMVAEDPSFLHPDSEDSGRTCHFVGFDIRQLNYSWQKEE